MKPSKLKIFSVLFLVTITSQAQKIRFIKPSISVSSTYYPTSKLVDSSGTYQNQNVQLGFCVPIWSHISQIDTLNKLSYFQICARNADFFSQPQISNLIQHQNLIGASLGISSIWVKNKRNIFAVSLNSNCRNDETTIQNPSFRFSGSALYRRSVSAGFSYHIGLVYSYIIGRDVWLPAIGISFKAGNRGRMNINFPNKISYVQRFRKNLSVTAYLKPYGTYNYITNKNYSLASTAYYLRQRENHLGIGGIWKISSSLVSSADVGFSFNRRVQLSDGLEKKSYTYFKSKIENGVYFGLGLKYVFRNQKKWKAINPELLEDEKEELLSDPYLENLILD